MGGQGWGGELSSPMLFGSGLTCGPGPMGPIPRGGFILCMGPPMLGCPVGRKAAALHGTAATSGPKLRANEKR